MSFFYTPFMPPGPRSCCTLFMPLGPRTQIITVHASRPTDVHFSICPCLLAHGPQSAFMPPGPRSRTSFVHAFGPRTVLLCSCLLAHELLCFCSCLTAHEHARSNLFMPFGPRTATFRLYEHYHEFEISVPLLSGSDLPVVPLYVVPDLRYLIVIRSPSILRNQIFHRAYTELPVTNQTGK